ncbi:insulinase family protein [Microbulbifer salipaludis]|uniref:Insulinase family protein n=1 Tax=Microbulbifer salipaludis TaxID=187980 RepID=A0ABS3E439_9GAMM|nr:pitrilysin family protein [Microbulbifer salipaludis]MBN8430068.1 insulinase family protein [Microbulbifer salipaludis]
MPRNLTASLALLTALSIPALGLFGCDRSSTQSEPKPQTEAASKAPAEQEAKPDFSIDYQQFQLDNGLNVLFHIDRSDPVVAVSLTAHVGSAREKAGRTGFAHLFEHLLFLESENLGKGGLDAMSARIGGSGANGSTSRDVTNYYQTVPKDALEKMLWAEADKLGWFINTVTDPVLAKEKQVVKNEKRQGVDNRPYGHSQYVIDRNLYPEGHPYSWQVIGSLEDLDNATLDDVKTFFRRWYVPNNVTLVVAGDFDPEQAKALVQKYFGEIPAGEAIERAPKQPVTLKETKRRYYEDNFARQPQLTLAWPTVPRYSADSYPLAVLSEYLSRGKRAPLYRVLVEDEQLTSLVAMGAYQSELAGQVQLEVQAFAERDLDTVYAGIQKAFALFEKEGIAEQDLERIKAGQEVAFYNSLSSVLGKGFQLAQYQIYADDPGYVTEDIARLLAVTAEDVQRVYKQYIQNKPFVAVSFVPKGEQALALADSTEAQVVEEKIVNGAEEAVDPSAQADYARTPSKIDRAKEPAYGEPAQTTVPDVWQSELANGVDVFGIENSEVPTVLFSLVIDGGQLQESIDKTGVANLTAMLMERGTAKRTPEELETAIQMLGASINVSAGQNAFRFDVTTLARNFNDVFALLEEILLEPRWDKDELVLAKKSVASQIQRAAAEPNAIASKNFARLLHGKDSIRGYSGLGTEASVADITMDDLKAFYKNTLSPSVARLHVVGDIPQADFLQAANGLAKRWPAKAVAVPDPKPVPAKPGIYFIDVPGAKQSVLRIGRPAMSAVSEDYYPAVFTNYILGGGGFASRLTQQLREGKGYTYGIRSVVDGEKTWGDFMIGTGVRANVTAESVQLIHDILSNYAPTYTEQDLETSRSYLVRSNARAFETAGAKLGLLENMSTYGWPADYVREREATAKAMTVVKVQKIAEQYMLPGSMIWVVVGDRATQLEPLQKLGLGEVTLLDEASLASNF